MSSIFLSHASPDAPQALELKRRLAAAGYATVFLSSDPQAGLTPGTDWERTLYRTLRSSDALVALCTPSSEASRWCFAEVTQARALGKPIFPVLLGVDEPPAVLRGVHAARFPEPAEPSIDVLLRGLSAAGVQPGPDGSAARCLRAVRRHAVPLVAASLLLTVFLAWYFARPAYLTASSIPAATLRLDGRDLGTTPVSSLVVDPGEHELRFEHPRFRPFVRRFRATRGSTFEIERGLEALDPGDPEALRSAARAAGISVSEVRSERSGGEPPPLLVLFPRGRLREAPSRLRLWGDGDDVPRRVVLELEPLGPSGKGWQAEVPPTLGPIAIDIPPEVRATLVPGATFRTRVLGPSGAEVSAAQGSVMSASERAGPDRSLARLAQAYEGGDATRTFLEVEVLLEAGLFEEAWARTEALRTQIGPRREVARLGLAVLDRAGLNGLASWDEWVALHEAGR